MLRFALLFSILFFTTTVKAQDTLRPWEFGWRLSIGK